MYLHIGDGVEVRGTDLIGIFTRETMEAEENLPFRRKNGISETGDAVKSYIVTTEGIKTSIVASVSISARGKI